MRATGNELEFLLPSRGQLDLQGDVEHLFELPRVPPPRYEDVVPSYPLPGMDSEVDAVKQEKIDVPGAKSKPITPRATMDQGPEWSNYPRSLLGSWTHDQVEKWGILRSTHNEICSVHKVDVFEDGSFDRSDEDRTVEVQNPGAYWNRLQTYPPVDIRVRALFVENMTVPVLQMLGTKYNIEPFFFASSANWVSSVYQECPKPDEDHITIVLPFFGGMLQNPKPIVPTGSVRTGRPLNQLEGLAEGSLYDSDKPILNTQAPLILPGSGIVLPDLLAIHMYRTPTTSTIISYHHTSELQRTSAKRLQSLVQRTGNNPHWSNIFQRSKDPTFVCLAILWYALYGWCEAFEAIHRYIGDLEHNDPGDGGIKLVREVHKLQAHLLDYQKLLRDFWVSVEFVRDTPNPAMSVPAISAAERHASADLLRKEANNLISEIDRLAGQRLMLINRLQNVTHLAFTSTNITHSRTIQYLAISKLNRAIGTRQIAYLAIVFFPGGFLANVFRMKLRQFDSAFTWTLTHYVEAAVGLTLFVWWLVIALQQVSIFYSPGSSLVRRALWPLFYLYGLTSTATRSWHEHTRLPNYQPPPQSPTPQAMLYFMLEETPGESNPI